jgi:formamidopyrimidine-DNA glycosylase
MPELPEVETIRRGLVEKVKGRKIIQVEIRLTKLLKGISEEEFIRKVEGKKIEEIRRRAKLLIIDLYGSNSLLIHLKMTGRLLYLSSQEEITKHTHLIFYLDNSMTLRFWDLRQFGYIKVVAKETIFNLPEISQLGSEPLEPTFTQDEFKRLIKGKKRGKIKPLLMDQRFIAGIGNLYGDEICYLARVKPTREISTLTDQEITALYTQMRKVLLTAIEQRGSSVDEYRDIYNQPGQYHFQLKVYGREGEECYSCGQPIQRIKLRGRSTHFCSYCQR